jgi:Na+-transporting NADH:ubiquinone oxidoreductase subunit B
VASIRGHEIAEGFLVTGMLYPLILPPTIPYWMAALGIAFGVIIGKELFGGTGMNILNPALTARAFLFFTFPGKMTGDLWVGTNPTIIQESLKKMNLESGLNEIDGITQATPLGTFNSALPEIKRIHVDAIASNTLGSKVPTFEVLERYFQKWKMVGNHTEATLGNLSLSDLQSFVTSSTDSGGLGLASEQFTQAYQFADTSYGIGHLTDGNLFFGNILGSMGETSTFACLLGALFLIYTGIGSWRIMVAFGISAFLFASLFEWASYVGVDGGAWNTARFAMPAYRHLLMGGLAFGLVFMATDPVSAPTMKAAKWVYGALIGVVTLLIRLINPAYPEGVMLAILFANVFAPLIDYHAIRNFRRGFRGRKALHIS